MDVSARRRLERESAVVREAEGVVHGLRDVGRGVPELAGVARVGDGDGDLLACSRTGGRSAVASSARAPPGRPGRAGAAGTSRAGCRPWWSVSGLPDHSRAPPLDVGEPHAVDHDHRVGGARPGRTGWPACEGRPSRTAGRHRWSRERLAESCSDRSSARWTTHVCRRQHRRRHGTGWSWPPWCRPDPRRGSAS